MRYTKAVLLEGATYQISPYLDDCVTEAHGKIVGQLVTNPANIDNKGLIVYIPETHYAFNFALLYWHIDDQIIRYRRIQNPKEKLTLRVLCDIVFRDIQKELEHNTK